MWPLCVISEKLFRMAGDDGGHGPGSPSADYPQIPLARRSYCVDVSPSPLSPSLSRRLAQCCNSRLTMPFSAHVLSSLLVDTFRLLLWASSGDGRFHMCSRSSPGTAASPACSWCSGRWGFIAATALPISRASAAPQGPPPLSDYWRVFTVFKYDHELYSSTEQMPICLVIT